MASTLTLKEAAERAGVTPATLKRWAETGVIPGADDKDPDWTPAVIAHARIVAIVHGPDGQVVTVETAPHDLPRLDQYRHLVELLAARR